MSRLEMLAFDLGAASGRAIVGGFDGKRLSLEEIHRFANEPVGVAGHIYWDVLRLFHEVRRGVGNFTAGRGARPASLGIDAWGVDYCPLDADGLLMGNPYHYRDPRTEGMSDAAFGLVPKREIYDETGISFEKFNTLFQMLWETRREGNILRRADSVLFMPDLLAYFLTGVKCTDSTTASTSQLMAAGEKAWNSRLLAALGIPERIMPEIADPGTIRGLVTEDRAEGLRIAGTPVVTVAGHDTASAIAAVPSPGEGSAFISSGTWSLMGVETDAPVITDRTFDLNYSNERRFGGHALLKNIMGAWLIQECRKKWEEAESRSIGYDELATAAAASRPFASFIDPNCGLFYQPGDMPSKIAEYCRATGQPAPETPGDFTRCIYESLALKYREALSLLESIQGGRIDRLHIIGGGANNSMLNRFTAGAIGRPVVGGPVEATAIGNILVQAIALGELGDLAQAREVVRNSFGTEEFAPSGREAWDAAYGTFADVTARYGDGRRE